MSSSALLLPFLSLFNCIGYIVASGRIIVNNELGKIWEEGLSKTTKLSQYKWYLGRKYTAEA
jgi:hypothetical protein